MRVTVLLFAHLRELTGSPRLVRDVPEGATVEAVWEAVTAEFRAARPYRASVSAAVNADFAPFSAPVADGDEVAFLPPVSGG